MSTPFKKRPNKFISLQNRLLLACNLKISKDSTSISEIEFVSNVSRLNLKMCESSVDDIIKQFALVMFKKSGETVYKQSLKNLIRQNHNPIAEHRLNQLIHDLLFSETSIDSELPWQGQYDFYRIYYLKLSSATEIIYFNVYDRKSLIETVVDNAECEIRIPENTDYDLLYSLIKFELKLIIS